MVSAKARLEVRRWARVNTEVNTEEVSSARTRHNRRGSHREAVAALATARGQDRPTRARPHPQAKAVHLVTTAVVRLVRTLAHGLHLSGVGSCDATGSNRTGDGPRRQLRPRTPGPDPRLPPPTRGSPCPPAPARPRKVGASIRRAVRPWTCGTSRHRFDRSTV